MSCLPLFRGQGPDGAASEWRERAVCFLPAEWCDGGAPDLACRFADGCAAVAGSDDRRSLGVCVERIVLRGANELRVVPVDHPGLLQGWWAVEHDGTALRRWTEGDALLPLPALDGPMILEIRASNGGMTYLASANQDGRVA